MSERSKINFRPLLVDRRSDLLDGSLLKLGTGWLRIKCPQLRILLSCRLFWVRQASITKVIVLAHEFTIPLP